MLRKWRKEIVARNGHTLVVGIVARISGCAKQKEQSLEDQVAHAKTIVDELYDGPVEYRIIATKGKGERLDRPELAEIEAELEKHELDLFIMEDLGRLVRGVEAVRLLGVAVDNGTRAISPHDNIDTDEPNWEHDALDACKEHVGHNVRTSWRLKQKMMNRFVQYGESAARPIAGYIVPPDAKSYDGWQKDESVTPLIQEGARRLKETLNGSLVADWFRQNNMPVGKYIRRKDGWNGVSVLAFYRNTLLSGRPSRGTKVTKKHHQTGRRVSVRNPDGPNYYVCEHLAHIQPVEQDELIALLAAKNAKFQRPPKDGLDPLLAVPRNRSRCPGQHAVCWYCGREMVWGANGITEHLMCAGAREWRCWNAIGVDGSLATQKLVEVILAELGRLGGIDVQFRAMIEAAQHNVAGGLPELQRKLLADEQSIARERQNLAAGIAKYGPEPFLDKALQELKAREVRNGADRYRLEQLRRRTLQLPSSALELRARLEEELKQFAADSYEFGALMRQLVPGFHVYLVRRVDGGHLLPRARIRLNLAGSVADASHVPALHEILSRELTIDLFRPTQRERIREEAVMLAAQGMKPKAIAAEIGEKPTATAVSNALELHDLMAAKGLTSPYVTLLEPPENYTKLRRHKNNNYRFEQREGYERPAN